MMVAWSVTSVLHFRPSESYYLKSEVSFSSIRYRRRKYIKYSMSEEKQNYYIAKAFFSFNLCSGDDQN